MTQTLAEIHSTENVRNKEKEGRKRTIVENTEVLQVDEDSGNVITVDFSMTF